jgi:hypothetical protein
VSGTVKEGSINEWLFLIVSLAIYPSRIFRPQPYSNFKTFKVKSCRWHLKFIESYLFVESLQWLLYDEWGSQFYFWTKYNKQRNFEIPAIFKQQSNSVKFDIFFSYHRKKNIYDKQNSVGINKILLQTTLCLISLNKKN